MLNCFTDAKASPIVPVTLIATTHFPQWLETQSDAVKNWLKTTGFSAAPETYSLVPGNDSQLAMVLLGVNQLTDHWPVGLLPTALPMGHYRITNTADAAIQQAWITAWGLGAYQFTRYKRPSKTIAQLVIDDQKATQETIAMIEAHYLVRTLITTPAEDMSPAELAEAATQVAKHFGATVQQIVGEELLKHNYPAIHAVGRASPREPRLIDLRWGNPKHPKITLVGKGVSFDTGGLNLKLSNGMLLMKKDMGGAAHALGLARMIMSAKLPVCLRVLMPAVDNAVAGNAYRPGDVITTRKGITVEIGNTDAEGRVILADALTEASSEQPELIIDFATLTGAARVAIGPDLGALFTDNDELADALLQAGETHFDPLWRLPLYAPYRSYLNSPIADINNASTNGFAGASVAGLFLKEFVSDSQRWAHLDIFAWNQESRAGRPQGGEAMGLRAAFSYLKQRFNKTE